MKKKVLVALTVMPTIVIVSMAAHLTYLNSHRECGPKDFSFSYTFEPDAYVDVSEESKESISKILDQKFFYLRCGKQMTAFESEDHKYVIKFYNPRTFIKDSWFSDWRKLKRLCSMKWISSAYIKRKQRLSKLSRRNRLAFQDLREESGLLYIHLNDATMIPKTITVLDKEENSVALDLRKCPFVLQTKVELATKYFDRLLKEGKIDEVKVALANLADLFVSRASKGYSDHIQTLHNNYGFIDGKPIQLDFGRLEKFSSAMPFDDVQRIFKQLDASISENYPELQTYTKELLEEKLQKYIVKTKL